MTCVQLREKELSEEDFLAEAKEIKALCSRYHVSFSSTIMWTLP
ncbi:MAG: thiamine phosphate synthase [Lachnospiraceae bacterium]